MSRDLPGLVRAAGERIGDEPFFAVADTVVGGREFQRRVECAAAQLVSDGLRPGDRLAVMLERSVEEAIALLAATCAGGIAVPVNGKLKDDQIHHLLVDSAPFAVVTSSVRLLALRDATGMLAEQALYHCGEDELPLPARGLGGHQQPDHTALAGVAVDPADPAVLLYTSGSTGLAKGVVQTHGNLVRGAEVVADYLALTRDDHVLALLPLSFDYGLNQLLSGLHVGCRVTAADHLGGGELAELLRAVRPTGLAGVPSLWHEVARGLTSGTLLPAHGASLRYLTNSGGALRPADSEVLRAHWPRAEIFAMYGLTEAFRSAYLPPEQFDRHSDSFGFPIAGVELLLVDPQTGDVLEGEATGELVHAGELIASGYWQRPAETAERFRPDPRGSGELVVYTGDLVRRDRDGRFVFVGRLDKMLKVHGHRVSPDEIAAVFVGVDGAGELFAFGIEGGAEGHRIVLAVAGDAGDADLVQRLQQRGRARLPSYMLPAQIHVLPTLPHNQRGKVDEPALREMIGACTDDT